MLGKLIAEDSALCMVILNNVTADEMQNQVRYIYWFHSNHCIPRHFHTEI
jgi:hypothetical protein